MPARRQAAGVHGQRHHLPFAYGDPAHGQGAQQRAGDHFLPELHAACRRWCRTAVLDAGGDRELLAIHGRGQRAAHGEIGYHSGQAGGVVRLVPLSDEAAGIHAGIDPMRPVRRRHSPGSGHRGRHAAAQRGDLLRGPDLHAAGVGIAIVEGHGDAGGGEVALVMHRTADGHRNAGRRVLLREGQVIRAQGQIAAQAVAQHVEVVLPKRGHVLDGDRLATFDLHLHVFEGDLRLVVSHHQLAVGSEGGGHRLVGRQVGGEPPAQAPVGLLLIVDGVVDVGALTGEALPDESQVVAGVAG